MGNHAKVNVGVIDKIALQKKAVSRRRPQVVSRRSKAVVEVVDEHGDCVAFDKYQLSPYGVFLYSQYLHCEGEKINLRVSLPSLDTPMFIEGEVINATVDLDPGMGIAFRKIKPLDRKYLQDYVAKRFIENER